MSEAPAIRPVWRVSFSGHRQLADPERIRAALARAWEELGRRVDGDLEGCSGAAEGADLLFAEVCLDSGAPWHAVLPYDWDTFSPEVGPGWTERLERARREAVTVTVVSTLAAGTEAYYAGGIATIEAADILLVIWNGRPAAGRGGTGDMVEEARARGLPWVWVHSETGEIDWSGFPAEQLRDPMADDVARLRARIPAPDDPSPMGRLFHQLDQAANQNAPRFRWIASANLQLHAVAIALAAVAMKFTSPTFSAISAWGKVGLLSFTVGLFFYAKYRALHHNWLLCRAGAELLRSLRASAPFLGLREFDTVLETFPRFRRWIRPCLVEGARWARGRSPRELVDWYCSHRLAPQEAYFSRSLQRLQRTHRLLERGFLTFSLGGLAAAVAYVIASGPLLAVAAIILPVLAMTVLAVNSSLDVDHRLTRYQDMERVLAEARLRLARVSDHYHLNQIVRATERQLLQEVGEWYQRTRHLHIH